MKVRQLLLPLASFLLLASAGLSFGAEPAHLRFLGGPPGGNFERYAKALTIRLNEGVPETEVSNSISAGSVENLRQLNAGKADFGIVYAGDIYLAREGQLPYDARIYRDVLAMARLYGAPAQLMVLEKSGIATITDLAGKRIAIGQPGSGAAAAAQRYFTSPGMWDEIKIDFIGYQDALSSLVYGFVDAIWVFAGMPNETVLQASDSYAIRLLDLTEAGREAGFFNQYPFFTPTIIPAGTYPGIKRDISTFQDAAVWATGAHLDNETVRAALQTTFSPEGLDEIAEKVYDAPPPAREKALDGIKTPLHTGAQVYWGK